MKRLLMMLVALTCVVAEAAPIPKSLKRKQSDGNPNGVWQLTKFNSNGKEGGHEHMAQLWEIDGEKFYVGIQAIGNRGIDNGSDFIISNPNDPEFRLFAGSPSRLKVDGDLLCWVYANDKNKELLECEPGQDRFYYEFKRVK